MARAAAAARNPNIVLIVADDLGYGELGIQGGSIPTPHIDSIGAAGVRFTQGYVSCPVCSPTRAGLMTGRYQQRFGHELNPGPAQEAADNFGLPLDQVTLADRLKKLGYRTGMVGKWHLGYKPEYHPQKRGFDEFFGFLGGAHPYNSEQAGNPILRGTTPAPESAYLTTAFAREAASFIDRHAAAPFFLYLPFNAVHNPLQATDEYSARTAHIGDPKRRTFAAMLTALDDAVGAILDRLRRHKLDNDTLVIFISDNGGPTPQTSSQNGSLRGFKAQVYEGGIRVPLLMRWTGRIPKSSTYTQPVIALDLHSTAVAAAGGSAPGLDGVDLFPYLAGKRPDKPHQTLFWRFGTQSAVRHGPWKLLRLRKEAPPQLYNLDRDPAETNDLATAEPARTAELEALYSAWDSQLQPPTWQGGGAARAAGKAKRKKA